MRCFENLVKSRFLANVSNELSLARQAVRSMSQTFFPPSFFADKKERKKIYDEYVYQYYLLEEIQDSLMQEADPDTIFYLQMDHIAFIYSLRASQVKDATIYNYNVNGNFPFYRGRHRVSGHTIYTVLFDTRLQFNPMSPN